MVSAQSRQLAARFHAGWTGTRVPPVKDRHYHVRIGSRDRTRGGETATVTKIVVHPGWQWTKGAPRAAVDDIALLKRDHRVISSCLPRMRDPCATNNYA